MALKILIVEDQAIEASDLRRILQNAGHTVVGISKSVDQALGSLKRSIPDVVLIDIFLKGPLTGINLAHTLGEKNIPFVYLSANSNPSTLEAAKATQPYGFLVKPFRERDVLVSLDIACYRHKHAMDLKDKQEKWLGNLLTGILNEVGTQEQKLLLLVKALRPFVPFELVFLDTDCNNDNPDFLYIFQRVTYEEYRRIHWQELARQTRLESSDINHFRKTVQEKGDIRLVNGTVFAEARSKDKFMNKIGNSYGVNSAMFVPLLSDQNMPRAINFFSTQPENFTNEQSDLLRPMRALLTNVLRFHHMERMTSSNKDILPVIANVLPILDGIIGKSTLLLNVLDKAVKVAGSDATVLITGETGVGKEGIAAAIHQLSNRRTKPFIKVNCAAIPEALIESELFGHERGAFTNALERRIGKFEQAKGGTIFLDEIGELPLATQSKLLRVLQEREIDRVGGNAPLKIDVRIVLATNRQLHMEVAEGRFRMDLYYRINVFPIVVPALRERIEDLPLLVAHFLKQQAIASGANRSFSKEAMLQLTNYSWPGNIRELQHVIERHLLIDHEDLITSVQLPENHLPALPHKTERPQQHRIAADDAEERQRIMAALAKCKGKVSGSGGAAELLGIKPSTLAAQIKRMGINWTYF